MSHFLQIFLILCGLFFFSMVVWLILKHKITERHSIVWLSGSLFIFFLSGNPSLLDWLAGYVGVDYPPSLLFLLSTLILLVISLYQSIQLTKMNDRIKELVQFMALHYSYKESENVDKPTYFSLDQEGKNRDYDA